MIRACRGPHPPSRTTRTSWTRPANTRPGFSNTAADGFRFCSELAAIVQAEVIAAVETQYYQMTGPSNLLRRILNLGPQDTISFGDWEGTVYPV
jgi:hypothetical protein